MSAVETPSSAALDPGQALVVARERLGGPLVVAGNAGTGKTHALVQRALRLAEAPCGSIVLTAPSDPGIERLRARLRDGRAESGVACKSLGDLAFDVLGRRTLEAPPLERIDDVTASLHFERVGAGLFALEWTEFALDETDPEITGLHAPERFAAAAFRLIRKLRASLISPAEFRESGLRGATAFYAAPPNFANAALLAGTSARYHDSLRVAPQELERQRMREIDLVKVLTRLYESYVATLVARGCLTPTDAVYEAALALRDDGALRDRIRLDVGAILVDDSQDLTHAQLELVRGLAHDGLANATFAGDEAQSTRAFATGARGIDNVRAQATVQTLTIAYRAPARYAFRRATDVRDEARYVADDVRRLVGQGVPANRIAVVTRNLRTANDFVDALLARDVPVDLGGSASLYDLPPVADALAALWSASDPYRHDYLLRALQAPWLALSDASIATLCGDASEPQPLLFEVPGDAVARDGGRRWDRKRDVRLGRNVTRGDVDTLLDARARERLESYRGALRRWERAARDLDAYRLAGLVLHETVVSTAVDGARGRYERLLAARLLDDVAAFTERDPLASLGDYLEHVEVIAQAEDDLLAIAPRDEAAVRVLDVEYAKGESFDAVFVVDVRAGAWPRYYVPDAFLFLPKAGMIPKENVGDAQTLRTAKFTYALHRYGLAEKYYREDRRAFECATSRSGDYVSISVSGRATSGRTAPELFEELRTKHGR